MANELGIEIIPMFNHLGHASASRVMHGKHVVLDQNPKLQPLFSEDGWSWNLDNQNTVKLLRNIREELIDGGYIKAATVRKKSTKDDKQFKEYTSDEGYKILVGKNNRQNDYITTCLANKSDLWFHVKNIPGSHVVVFSGGKEVSDTTVLKAAALAAKNSKAAASSNVAVDYTPIKFVKKPHGAKPGIVIYTTNKTVYVTPEGD